MVLSDLLHRWEQRDGVGEPEHKAEWIALWNMSCLLESNLAEVLDPAYNRLIEDARMRLTVNHGTDDKP
jgi:hypothetical protein